MAIKGVVATLEEVPEALREHYEASNGKYVLKAEGMVTKEKLEEFRGNNIELQRKLDELKDVDPAEYKRMKKEVDDAKAAAAKGDPAKLEELLAERVAEMRKANESEISTLKTSNAAISARLENVLVDNALQSAAVEAGVNETALEDVVRRGRDVFRLKDDRVLPYKGEHVQYGSDGVTPMTMKEWLAGLAGNAPHLFKQSSGGGASNNGGRGGSDADLSKLPPTEQLKAARRAGAK